MKKTKLLKIFSLSLAVICAVFCLGGCGQSQDELRAEVLSKLTTVSSAPLVNEIDYTPFFTTSTFSYARKSEMTSDENFSILFAYDSLLNFQILPLINYYNEGILSYATEGKSKTDFSALSKQIDKYKEVCVDFLAEKNIFEEKIGNRDLGSAIATEALGVYKTNFFELISSANKLGKTFLSAYKSAYLLDATSLTVQQTQLFLYDTLESVLPSINYFFSFDYSSVLTLNFGPLFYQGLLPRISTLITKQKSTLLSQNQFGTLKKDTNALLVELSMFDECTLALKNTNTFDTNPLKSYYILKMNSFFGGTLTAYNQELQNLI